MLKLLLFVCVYKLTVGVFLCCVQAKLIARKTLFMYSNPRIYQLYNFHTDFSDTLFPVII